MLAAKAKLVEVDNWNDEDSQDEVGESSSDEGDMGDEDGMILMAPHASHADAAPAGDGSDGGEEVDSDDESDIDAADERAVMAYDQAIEGSSGGEGSDGEVEGRDEKPGTSFARAFQKVVGSGVRSSRGRDPILAASKSVIKRHRDEEEESRTNRDAKKRRLEMKKRGHKMLRKKGDDPVVDARERALMRMGTKGVVRLFNAVAKAQKQQEEASLSGTKASQAAKLSKATFLAELKGAKTGQPTAKLHVGPREEAVKASPPRESSWSVLKEGFSGLEGGTKLKDWDKQQDDSDIPAEEEVLEGFSDSDDGDW